MFLSALLIPNAVARCSIERISTAEYRLRTVPPQEECWRVGTRDVVKTLHCPAQCNKTSETFTQWEVIFRNLNELWWRGGSRPDSSEYYNDTGIRPEMCVNENGSLIVSRRAMSLLYWHPYHFPVVRCSIISSLTSDICEKAAFKLIILSKYEPDYNYIYNNI